MEKKRAHLIGSAILLCGLAILLLTDWWWPGIAVVLATSMSVSDLLRGRRLLAMLTPIVTAAVVVTFTLVDSLNLWTCAAAAVLLILGISNLSRALATKSSG